MAATAEHHASAFAQQPLQLLLALGRLTYVLQHDLLPVLESVDLGQYGGALWPLLVGEGAQPGDGMAQLERDAAINTTAALLALGSALPEAPADLQAFVVGAGPLLSCQVSPCSSLW